MRFSEWVTLVAFLFGVLGFALAGKRTGWQGRLARVSALMVLGCGGVYLTWIDFRLGPALVFGVVGGGIWLLQRTARPHDQDGATSQIADSRSLGQRQSR